MISTASPNIVAAYTGVVIARIPSHTIILFIRMITPIKDSFQNDSSPQYMNSSDLVLYFTPCERIFVQKVGTLHSLPWIKIFSTAIPRLPGHVEQTKLSTIGKIKHLQCLAAIPSWAEVLLQGHSQFPFEPDYIWQHPLQAKRILRFVHYFLHNAQYTFRSPHDSKSILEFIIQRSCREREDGLQIKILRCL